MIFTGSSANCRHQDGDQDGDHRTDSGENSKDCLEIHNFTFIKIRFMIFRVIPSSLRYCAEIVVCYGIKNRSFHLNLPLLHYGKLTEKPMILESCVGLLRSRTIQREKLFFRVTPRDVLRAVPVKCRHLDDDDAFDFGAVLIQLHLLQ